MSQTSLGITVWSKWVGGGIREAHREISGLDDRMRRMNSSFLISQGRASLLKTSLFALAPAVKTLGGVMAGTAASASSGFIAAAASAGIYAKVMIETTKRTQEMHAAGKELSAAQQRYVDANDRMRHTWNEFLKANEYKTLMSATGGIAILTEGIKHLQPIVDTTSKIFTRQAVTLLDWTMRADGAARASQYLAVYGGSALEDYAEAATNVLAALGFGFRESLKNMDNMNKGVVQLTANLRAWAEGGGFVRFFEWVAANRPTVDAFFDALVAAFKNLTSAVGTLGPIMLKIATVILNFIASVDPNVIVAFYLAMLSLKVIAVIVTIVHGLTAAFTALLAVMQFIYANPIVLAIAAIAAVLIFLWVKVEAFRNFWIAAWELLVKGVKWAWENGIKPAIDAIGRGMVWLWENGIRPVVNYIRAHWEEWMRAAKWAWDNLLWPVFQAIGVAALWVWNVILKPVIDQIVKHWDGWMQTAKLAWEGLLKPVFEAIATVAVWLWNTVLKPVFGFIADHWDEMCTAMKWVWDNILKPMFIVLGVVVEFLWKTILSVVFNLIAFGFRAMVEIMVFTWNNILEPMFKLLGLGAESLWNFILKPIFFMIGEAFKLMVAVMKLAWEFSLKPAWDAIALAAGWLWEHVLRPTFGFIAGGWDAMVASMKWVWEHVLKPLWETLVESFMWVKNKIGEGVSGIAAFWEGLKNAILAPVQWVIDVVWNNGLVKAWNWINDLWGGDNIQPFSFSPSGAGPSSGQRGGGGGQQAFASGGAVRGPGSGTSDSINARLSNGEHVWTAREVRNAGGHQAVAALRSAVMGGAAVRGAAAGPGFAEGGFWGGIKDFFSGAAAPAMKIATAVAPSLAGFTSLADGLRGTINGASGFAQNMVGMAKGIGTKALDAVVAFVTDKLMPKMSGGGMGWRAMWDIVRGAFPDGTLTSAQRNTNDYHGSGQAIDVAWPMTQFGKSRMLELNKWIASRYPDSTELIHTPGINLKNGKPTNYGAATQAAHYDHVHWAMAGGPGGSVTSGDGWRSLVLQELAHVGQPASLADTVLRRLQQESGGNARAINNWDINAQNGTPSKGLMQVIDPTFAAYKSGAHPNDIWDPGANMHAAFNYAMARYGSLSSAFNRPGGYAMGTNGALRGWNWVGERGAELVKFRGGEKVLNAERLRRMSGMGNSRGSDRPLVDTGGAPLVDARGATKDAVEALNKDTLPKLNQILKQLRGH